MTAYDRQAAEEALARLVKRGEVIPLPDPVHISAVIDGTVERLEAENADLRKRLQAVHATCWPLHRNPGPLGDFARTVLAEADPQPEHAA